jgi:hypothetical protein
MTSGIPGPLSASPLMAHRWMLLFCGSDGSVKASLYLDYTSFADASESSDTLVMFRMDVMCSVEGHLPSDTMNNGSGSFNLHTGDA